VTTLQGKEVVFVVGAGASQEADLPTGPELKEQIQRELNIRYQDGYTRSSGSVAIDGAFRIIAKNNGSRDINSFLHASWKICEAMPLAPSIDNFIDSHRDDALIAQCGKLAIAHCILAAERRSPLCLTSRTRDKIPFESLEKTWYSAFFQKIASECHKSELAARLEKIAIVCFNYDRCIEHYLYHALQNYYSLSSDQAKDLVNAIEIHHPYGTVGKLPWQDGDTKRQLEFGGEGHPQRLVDLIGELRTFSEGTDIATSQIGAIRTMMAAAKRIVFLGFAYHPLNLELLFPGLQDGEKIKNGTRVFGTALGVSESDMAEIRTEIAEMGGYHSTNIQLRNLKCAALFSEFGRSMKI
jgi:hypothetical protein